ncbi:MAG: hypothetical protein MRZ79_04430 [Bacteroidia bacterium]|nr:hypothetical protein [Bacteroidia bacterium]
MTLNFNNLVEATAHYMKEGYTDNLHLMNDQITCKAKNASFGKGEFTIDAVHRFEENTDPSDNSVLYAISSGDGSVKGMLIDAYGVYESEGSNLFLLKAEPVVNTHKTADPEGFKYGVRKLTKAEFNENPGRYELRKGFPDFPSCPWGNNFSMLGYDKEKSEYVWFVSSILKDSKLETTVY